jgi:LPXTG-motif cell wall-anchored protein
MTRQLRVVGAIAAAFLVSAAGLSSVQAQTPPAGAVTLYGLTLSNKLIRFNSGSPSNVESSVQVGNLAPGENVIGIDFRPATGQLFGLSSNNRLLTIDPANGAASIVGSAPFTTTLTGGAFGFDFNPAVDRIRVTSDNDQDLRLNPNNGGIAAIDGTLTYTTTDRNAGQNPNVVASAYTNNVPGPASTTLYNLDSNLDVLVTQNPPNSGTLNTVGALGVDIQPEAGFDIVGANTAFAVLRTGDTSALYTINLTTGAATIVGSLGVGEVVRGLTAALSAAPATVTPVPATATVTATVTATAAATGTPRATTAPATTATTQPTAATTVAPASTVAPATATSVPVAPTTAPPVLPTEVPVSTPAPAQTVMPGMPNTGGEISSTLYLVLALFALGLVAAGFMSRRNRNVSSSAK